MGISLLLLSVTTETHYKSTIVSDTLFIHQKDTEA